MKRTTNLMKWGIRYTMILVAILSMSSLTSCIGNDDDDNEFITAEIATYIGGDRFNCDFSGIRSVANFSSFTSEIKEGQRFILYYRAAKESEVPASSSVPLKDYIYVTNCVGMLTKDVVVDEPSQIGLYGTDPVICFNGGIDGGYINISFGYRRNDPDIAHGINLLVAPNAAVDPEGYITAYLCHNANNDEQTYDANGYASFKLSSLPNYDESTFKGIKLITKGYMGQEIIDRLEVVNHEE